MKNSIFQKFTVRDVVFLAIVSAVATLTAAVMAIVAHIYIFGLAQLVTALQFSLFPAIALMRVRKPGTILFFSLFTGLVELFMAPVMFWSSLLTGILLEAIMILIFHGYESNRAVFFASWLFIPMTLPWNYLYYRLFSSEYYQLFFSGGVQIASIACILGTFAVSALGAFLGIKISKELTKAGVMKQ